MTLSHAITDFGVGTDPNGKAIVRGQSVSRQAKECLFISGVGTVPGRVINACSSEAEAAEPASIALAAGQTCLVCLVTRYGLGKIHAQLEPTMHDVRLGHFDQWGPYLNGTTFDAAFQGQIS